MRLDRRQSLLHCLSTKLFFDLVLIEGITRIVEVCLQTIVRLYTLHLPLILSLKVDRLRYHPLNVILAEAALVICNRDLIALTSGLLSRSDIEDTVCIHVKRHLNLRNTTSHRRNAIKLELA